MGKEGIEHRFTSENQPKNNGRPKGSKNLKTIINKYIDKMVKIRNEETGEIVEATTIDHIVLKMLSDAVGGDVAARKQLFDRLEGYPIQQTININSEVTNDKLKDLEDIFGGQGETDQD